MPAKPPTRPPSRSQLQTGTLVDSDPATISRLLSDLGTAQQASDATRRDRFSTVIDLVVGANKVNHGLGRRAQGMTLTPTVADQTFAWAMTASDDKQVTVTVLNVAQPKCPLEIF